MEKRSQYIIQFASLASGQHEFTFQITDSFFQPVKESLINKADVVVKAILEKGVNNLQLFFHFTGNIHVACVRCLDEFDIKLNEKRNMVVRQIEAVNGEEEEEEDVISIPLTSTELNLAPHLYDYLNLMVPLNPVHPDKKAGASGCNEESLKEMHKHMMDEESKHNDPRWEILKKLKLK